MKYVDEYRDALGATAGLSSSAESTVGQANRGTPVANILLYRADRAGAMKYVNEYRDADAARRLAAAIATAYHAAVEHHGGLRRADARHRPLRPG